MQLHGSWSHGWMIYILWKIEVKNDDAYGNDTFNEKKRLIDDTKI